MKINPILNMNFRGILDSNKAVNGKYLKYTAPLTRNTQQYGRVYNGSDVQNVSYFQYVQGLYSTYIKEDEDYRYAVTYIPLCEASELMSKANALKNSVKTVLKTCEAHRIEAKKIQQQLLDEFDEVNADMISDSDLAFKTVDNTYLIDFCSLGEYKPNILSNVSPHDLVCNVPITKVPDSAKSSTASIVCLSLISPTIAISASSLNKFITPS